jgi:cobalamin biosynthesis Mg chelatase CobN
VTVVSYSDTADFSGMDSVTDWNQYQVERPAALGVSTTAAVTEEVAEDVTTDTAETAEASEPTVTEEVQTEATATESNSTIWIIAVVGVLILAAVGAGVVIKKRSK